MTTFQTVTFQALSGAKKTYRFTDKAEVPALRSQFRAYARTQNSDFTDITNVWFKEERDVRARFRQFDAGGERHPGFGGKYVLPQTLWVEDAEDSSLNGTPIFCGGVDAPDGLHEGDPVLMTIIFNGTCSKFEKVGV